jgi:hypothetical protein
VLCWPSAAAWLGAVSVPSPRPVRHRHRRRRRRRRCLRRRCPCLSSQTPPHPSRLSPLRTRPQPTPEPTHLPYRRRRRASRNILALAPAPAERLPVPLPCTECAPLTGNWTLRGCRGAAARTAWSLVPARHARCYFGILGAVGCGGRPDCNVLAVRLCVCLKWELGTRQLLRCCASSCRFLTHPAVRISIIAVAVALQKHRTANFCRSHPILY